ncbi:DUF1570 domain-containing protein [Bythopirellula polymerisocia]|uniref:DUF1570 domain-containing protein n=1 Tax=Bythopirellula polymerisocia TaxID=2528003 RepID=A0A5C6CBR3_9BACT|nr:DUF1570 domain-containing protein [Bythopirellula polymerisocia]TWU21277.1 hypothetical protein Pla144_46860 [Bythopirellula polymerisocia]
MRQSSIFLVLFSASITLAGCMLVRPNQHWEPFPHEIVRNQLVIHSDAQISRNQRLLGELADQRMLINSKLGLAPTETPIHVYLYADEDAYTAFMNLRFPEMASRRAIFVGTDSQLSVYAYWGDHVAEDLRHEVSHGYLHAAVPNLPLWLDEGLAEYFEVGAGRQGFNTAHAQLLAAQANENNWQPELTRLEALNSAADMTQQDYAESWAWVHYLLESDERSMVLTDYLHDLADGNPTEPLSTRIGRRLIVPQSALAEHIRMLR